MYTIKWTDNGIEKSDVYHSWIERDAVLEKLMNEGFDPTYEIL